MHGAGTVSVLFVTMVPQTVVSMMSLTPPVMADDVVATLGLPAGAAGFYTGLIYFFVLITNIVAAPLIARFGSLNCVYFEKRSFSSSGSRVSLTQRRSAMARGSRFRCASKSATRRVRSSALAWQW